MSDRTLNWGESESAARYQTGDDDPDGGDFIVAKNTENETVLLQWNQTTVEWEFAGDVDMGGNDVTNAGLVSGVDGSFDTLEAEKAKINGYSSEDNRELVGFVSDTDRGSPASETIANVQRLEENDRYFVLEVLIFVGEESGEVVPLNLTIEGVGDGNYDYVLHDKNGSFDSRVTGADEYVLLESSEDSTPNPSGATFVVGGLGGRPQIGQESHRVGLRQGGKFLFNGDIGSENMDDPADFTFSTGSAAGFFTIALWAVQSRGEI